MNYTIDLPFLLLTIVLLLWYLDHLRRLFPERLRGWIDREGLTQKQAAERIREHLGNGNFDERTLRRWLAGEVPYPVTVLRMQGLLNGTDYSTIEI